MDRPRTLTPVFASASGLDKEWTGGTGVWEAPGNWTPPGMPGIYDRVSIADGTAVINQPRHTAAVTVGSGGTLIFTNWVAPLTARDVTVATDGLVTLPPAFAAGVMSNRVWFICTNLTVAAGGRIDADGKGYLGGYNGQPGHGPGGGEGNHHGGGGGNGGTGWCGTYLRGGPAYGEHEDPIYPGSGGGAHPDTRSRGGAGGGAIRIEALGEVIVDGTITADGGTGATYYSGGGSGGSVAIDCRRFGGIGVVTANGGLCANTGGGGGGGRIAVKYDELAGTPGVRFEACGADSPWPAWSSRFRWTQYRWTSQPGTLHFSDVSMLGTVITNLHGELHVPAFSSWAPPSLAVSNSLLRFPAGFDLRVGGNLTVGVGSAIELASGSFLSAQGNTRLDGGRLVMNGFTQATFRAGMELANGGRFYAYSAPTNGTVEHGASVDVAGDIRVGAGSWILPDARDANGGAVRFRCENAFIAADGGFDADGRGFLGGYFLYGRRGYGPGAGAVDNCGSGGGYGGRGGDAWEVTRWGAAGGMPYGLTTGPVWPGSGGGSQAKYEDGGHGGGLIWIEATGTVRADGILRADGGAAGAYAGGGSGGGIMVIASRFSGGGAGALSACGSTSGNPTRGAPGGGGLIVVATGLTTGERGRLLAGDPRNLRIVDLPQSFAGRIKVDPGLLGPDYAASPARAPAGGSAVFLKSAGGSLLLLR